MNHSLPSLNEYYRFQFPNIHIIIGLPGSGKTTLANELITTLEKPVLIDDLFIQLQKYDFNWKNTLHSFDCLESNYTDIVITDFLACSPLEQKTLFNKLGEFFPKSFQHWHFFNNDPYQCLENAHKRNNGTNIDVTLQSMTKIYEKSSFILVNAKTITDHTVFHSKQIQKTPKIK
jgi:GTPase SAR1 family protein